MADIERLTSDKADLLTSLQCYEEDLKTANECEKQNNQLNKDNHFQFQCSVNNERESYLRHAGSSRQERYHCEGVRSDHQVCQ